MQLHQQNILLGVTGGIAAYKTPDLVRKLKAKGANVRVVLTDSAHEFVSALSLQAVSGNAVSDDLLDREAELAMGHIELAKWADKILIAPCTANTIAKLAVGLADDLISTIVLATTAEIYLAPAMNQQMWQAEIVQTNLTSLAALGVNIISPDSGEQACGDVGLGRMPEPQSLADLLAETNSQEFSGKTIVITAGPTQEALDPVRYLTNRSSGKMGYALAEAAVQMGAEVILVSGPVSIPSPPNVKVVAVTSAQQMHQAVMQQIASTDIFIACAAVADYRPVQQAEQKIKKQHDQLTLTFSRNPDILADVAKLQQAPFTVGFAAETQDVAHYAKQKLARKAIDMIAANDVSDNRIGFNSDNNALSVFWQNGEQNLAFADKKQLAKQLMQLISQQYEAQK